MEKKYLIGISVNMILTVLGIVGTIMSIINHVEAAANIIQTVVLILAAYYAFIGYRSPHGNILKYLMIIFAMSLLMKLKLAITYGWTANTIIIPIAMMAIGYLSGRLDRVNQNKIITVIILLLLLFISFRVFFIKSFIPSISSFFTIFSNVIIWIDICGAYFIRYAQHKEAGIIDKPRK